MEIKLLNNRCPAYVRAFPRLSTARVATSSSLNKIAAREEKIVPIVPGVRKLVQYMIIGVNTFIAV